MREKKHLDAKNQVRECEVVRSCIFVLFSDHFSGGFAPDLSNDEALEFVMKVTPCCLLEPCCLFFYIKIPFVIFLMDKGVFFFCSSLPKDEWESWRT